jgi:SWI/SNF-related matrix-associated actin-dependent regulator of chromatin subfamily A3
VNLAVLDKRTTSMLQKVKSQFGAEFRVFKDDHSMSQSGKESRHQHQPKMVHLLIDIFGSRENVRAIGIEFSKARFYLQHPHSFQPFMEYENPHLFRSKNGKDKAWKFDQNDFVLNLPGPTRDAPEDEKKATAIEQILQARIQSDKIHEFEADSRVETKLLSHQKQALHFILQRERNSENLSLWKRRDIGSGSCYEHEITGNRTLTVPTSTGGGILADEMGLGKTLSMISAIVSSLEEASIHSQKPIAPNFQSELFNSKATLVLVPSAGAIYLDAFESETY